MSLSQRFRRHDIIKILARSGVTLIESVLYFNILLNFILMQILSFDIHLSHSSYNIW